MKKLVIIIFVIIYLIVGSVVLKVQFPILESSYYNHEGVSYSVEMQDKAEELALYLNEKYIFHNTKLTKGDLMTAEQAYERVYYLYHYAKELNHRFHKLNPVQVWLDLFAIISYETWWVNFRKTDNGLGFGYISMLWNTAEGVANSYNWDWDIDSRYISGSAILQSRYIVGLYYNLAVRYNGDRTRIITGYNKGNGVREEVRWENYFFLVYGRIRYFQDYYFKQGGLYE